MSVEDERNDIRELMPPEIVAAVDNIIDDLIARLGESPEAWWGAYEAIDVLMHKPIVTALVAEDEDASHILTMIMLVLGQFLSDPRSMIMHKVAKELRKNR